MATLWVSRTSVGEHHPVLTTFDSARQALILHLAQEMGLRIEGPDYDDGLLLYGIEGSLEEISKLVEVAYNWGAANFSLELAEGEDVEEAERLCIPAVEIIEP